jgi:hypothetical protein
LSCKYSQMGLNGNSFSTISEAYRSWILQSVDVKWGENIIGKWVGREGNAPLAAGTNMNVWPKEAGMSLSVWYT